MGFNFQPVPQPVRVQPTVRFAEPDLEFNVQPRPVDFDVQPRPELDVRFSNPSDILDIVPYRPPTPNVAPRTGQTTPTSAISRPRTVEVLPAQPRPRQATPTRAGEIIDAEVIESIPIPTPSFPKGVGIGAVGSAAATTIPAAQQAVAEAQAQAQTQPKTQTPTQLGQPLGSPAGLSAPLDVPKPQPATAKPQPQTQPQSQTKLEDCWEEIQVIFKRG